MRLTITQETWDASMEAVRDNRSQVAYRCVITRTFRQAGFKACWTGLDFVFVPGDAWRLTADLHSIRRAFDKGEATHPLLPYTFDYDPAPTGAGSSETDALAEELT